MAEEPELVPREREILEFSLNGGRKRVYRNYFAADLASLDGLTCTDLVQRGFMVRGRRLSEEVELFYFHVTEAGAKAVGLPLP